MVVSCTRCHEISTSRDVLGYDFSKVHLEGSKFFFLPRGAHCPRSTTKNSDMVNFVNLLGVIIAASRVLAIPGVCYSPPCEVSISLFHDTEIEIEGALVHDVKEHREVI